MGSLYFTKNNPGQALRYGNEAKKFIISNRLLGKEPKLPDYSISFSDISRTEKIGEDDYRQAEENLIYLIFVPLFTNIIGSVHSEAEAFEELAKWEDEITAQKSNLLLHHERLSLVQHFRDLILFWKKEGNIDNEFTLLGHKTSFEVFRELLSSERPNVSLNDGYKSQLRVAITLPKYGENAKYMYWGIGKFVHRHWLRVAQTQRFALHHPSMFYDELMAISPDNGADTLFDVLMSAGSAVGVSIPENVRSELNKVKKMAKPWL